MRGRRDVPPSTGWAQHLSADARSAKRGWKPYERIGFDDAFEVVCRQPSAGHYVYEDRAWVYINDNEPRFRFTYQLDRKRRVLSLVSVRRIIVRRRDELPLFLSYSKANRLWSRRLRRAFVPLREFGVMLWSDCDIPSGWKWHELIKEKVASAAGALLLVSREFLRTKYIQTNELCPFLKRAKEVGSADGGASFLLFWIPLEHEDFLKEDCWGERLLAFQSPVIKPSRPLATMPAAEAYRVLDKVREAVLESVRRRPRHRPSALAWLRGIAQSVLGD